MKSFKIFDNGKTYRKKIARNICKKLECLTWLQGTSISYNKFFLACRGDNIIRSKATFARYLKWLASKNAFRETFVKNRHEYQWNLDDGFTFNISCDLGYFCARNYRWRDGKITSCKDVPRIFMRESELIISRQAAQ